MFLIREQFSEHLLKGHTSTNQFIISEAVTETYN